MAGLTAKTIIIDDPLRAGKATAERQRKADIKWREYVAAQLAEYWRLFHDVKARIRARRFVLSLAHTYSHDAAICRHYGQLYKVAVQGENELLHCYSCEAVLTVGKDGRRK